MFDINSCKVIVSSHTIFGWGSGEMLQLYLKNCPELLCIFHPFSFQREKPSFYEIYRSGKLITKKEIGSTHGELISFIKDFLLTLKIVFAQKKKYDLFIGIDPLNGLAGIILKKFNRTQYLISFPIDYNPKRFSNKFLNFLYHKIQFYCAKNADATWFLTDEILKVFVEKGINKNKCNVVPVQIERIYSNENQETISPNIGYIGILEPEKGIELIIQSIPKVLKSIPNAKFIILGGGPLEKDIRKKIKNSDFENSVKLTGHIPSRKDAMELLSKCTIGIAPYIVEKNQYQSFGFGAKIFDYAACGLPIVITHWKQIEDLEMGLTIDYNSSQLAEAIVKLLKDQDLYKSCKENVGKFAQDHYYKKIYDEAFSKLSFFQEDGIIEKIFEIIKPKNKICVEFGGYDLKEFSNTFPLWANEGWEAIIIEGEKRGFEKLKKDYEAYIKKNHISRNVEIINKYVSPEGENSLDNILSGTQIVSNFDLLSIDVDGVDYHIWRLLENYKPRVVVIEINITIPPHISMIGKKSGNYVGAGILDMHKLGNKLGYDLVACTYNNAIFVNKEEAFHFKNRNSLENIFDFSCITYAFSAGDGSIFFSQRPTFRYFDGVNLFFKEFKKIENNENFWHPTLKGEFIMLIQNLVRHIAPSYYNKQKRNLAKKFESKKWKWKKNY